LKPYFQCFGLEGLRVESKPKNSRRLFTSLALFYSLAQTRKRRQSFNFWLLFHQPILFHTYFRSGRYPKANFWKFCKSRTFYRPMPFMSIINSFKVLKG